MASIRELLVKINGDSKGLDKAISQSDAVLGKFGISISGIKNMLTGPAGIAIAAGIAAKAIWDTGVKFNEAYASISKATGATGKDLEKLSFVFRNTMASGIEQPIQEVADAFGEISTRFGNSNIKEVTKLFSDFADVTNQQMAPAVKDVSQLTRNWGISTEELPGILDRLYVATATTGQSIGELSQGLTTGGAILRQAGYDFYEASTLLSAFYTAGIDSTRMLTGLNFAVAKFAQEGINAKDGIGQAFDAIKNARTEAEATAIAVETFGQRVGPQLADAIRMGKFSVEELNATLDGSKGKLAEVAAASDTIKDKWMQFVNAAQSAGSRAGEYWIELAEIGLEIVTPMMEHLARFGEIYFGRFVVAAQNVWKFLKPAFDTITTYLGGVIDFIGGVLSGNWKLAFNGLARSALAVVKFIVDGVQNLVLGVTKGLNALIDTINKGIAFLKLPIDPIKNITAASLGWTNGIDTLINRLEKQRDEIIGLDKSTFDFKQTTDDTTDAVSAAAEATDGYINANAMAYEQMMLSSRGAREEADALYNLEKAADAASLAASQQAIALADQKAGFDNMSDGIRSLAAGSSESQAALSAFADFAVAIATVNAGGIASSVMALMKLSGAGDDIGEAIDAIMPPLLQIFRLLVDLGSVLNPGFALVRAFLPVIIEVVKILGDGAEALATLIEAGVNFISRFLKPVTDWLENVGGAFHDWLVSLGLIKEESEEAFAAVDEGATKATRSIEELSGAFATLTIALEKLKDIPFIKMFAEAIKGELRAALTTSITDALNEALIAGSYADFSQAIGKLVYSIASQFIMAQVGIMPMIEGLSAMIVSALEDGAIDASEMSGIEAEAARIYSAASAALAPLQSIINSTFGTSIGVQAPASSGGGGGSSADVMSTSSFASGVRSFRGGIARVGEQGPEYVRLPAGASVYSRGETAPRSTVFNFNSPRELSPMETRRRYQVMSRQLAWEGNLA